MCKVICLIPARAGSKSIINKNTINLGGKPLISWTLDVATKSNQFSKIVVSTDDSRVKNIVKNYSDVSIIERPKSLSGDRVLQFDVIKHALRKNTEYDIVVLLQPTSPFRQVKDIVESIELFKSSNAQTLISVQDIKHINKDNQYLGSNVFGNYVDLKSKSSTKGTLKQDFHENWWRNGSIYIFRVKNILTLDQLYTPKIVGFKMPNERSINIDEQSDLDFARLLIR
jgi:CMP-N,N'-diacetyllegionaminic acid synthase